MPLDHILRVGAHATMSPLVSGMAGVLLLATLAVPCAQAQPSQARDICNALMAEARTERTRGQAKPASERARVVLERCMDLLPNVRGEAQGIVDWADRQQADADAAQRKTAEPAEAEPDIPLLSRSGGEATNLLRDRTAPAAAGGGAAGAGGGRVSDPAFGSCMARAEEAAKRGGPQIRSAGGMNATHHATATMLRAVIAELQPCAGDPRGAEQIRSMQPPLDAALKGCRSTSTQPASCDRPAY